MITVDSASKTPEGSGSPQANKTDLSQVATDPFPRRVDYSSLEALSRSRINLGKAELPHTSNATGSDHKTELASMQVIPPTDATTHSSASFQKARSEVVPQDLRHKVDIRPSSPPQPGEGTASQPQDDRSMARRLADFAGQKVNSVVSNLKYLHPADFVRRFKADFAALRDLSKSGGYEEIKSDLESLTKKIHGRLVASLVFSDTAAYLSLPIGIAVQAKTGDPYLTLAAGIGAGYAIAVGAFQAAFGFVSKDLYKRNNPLDKEPTKTENVLSRTLAAIKNFEADLFPIHVKAFKAALVCYAISVPLCSGIIESVKLLPLAVQHYVPISVIEMALSITLFEGMFLKMLSRFNETHAKNLASKYVQAAPPEASA